MRRFFEIDDRKYLLSALEFQNDVSIAECLASPQSCGGIGKAMRRHLKDRGYCTPIVDEAGAAAKKKKEELDREIELIKKQYEEKMKKRRKSKESKQKDKGKENGKDEKHEKSNDDDKDEDEKAEKEKNDQIKTLVDKGSTTTSEEGPRIFALQKVFYQRRLDRIRNAEIAKRNRERLKSPTLFPSVPSGDLG
ncbi:MAG: hypothetical protein Q9211_002746 [Gyalolechia sp. 1 TL-2023]